MDRPDTKLAIAVRDDLEVWQKLNVVAFLAAGLPARHPELVGAPYADADGTAYMPLIGHPVMCLSGPLELLRRARRRAVERGLTVGVYDHGMFATMNDVDNRAVVAARAAEEIDLVGLVAFGPGKQVDRALKGLKLHG